MRYKYYRPRDYNNNTLFRAKGNRLEYYDTSFNRWVPSCYGLGWYDLTKSNLKEINK